MYCVFKYTSPLGELSICSQGELIRGLWLEGQKGFMAGVGEGEFIIRESPAILRAEDWLEHYFTGKRPDGREIEFTTLESPFASCLRELLLDIPYGESRSYGELARRLSGKIGCSPGCARAVGNALGKNPVSIIIPCHRVLAASGIGGYAGGREAKLFLLRHEGII